MNRVGMRCNVARWLCAVVAVSLLATTALAAGAKQKAKVVAPKAAMQDTAISLMPEELRALPLERTRTDGYMNAPVFPPLGHQTRDEADRLRLMNTPKTGALTVAPYPSPVIDSGSVRFRGGWPHGITPQSDGRPAVPAPTPSDTAGSGPLPKAKRGRVVPKPH